jgi:predicted phosphoribosyltransferase
MGRVVADALDGDLDVVLVHKLGHPDQPELAIGAIDETGGTILSDWAAEAGAAYIESEKQHQLATLRRRRAQYTPLGEPMDPSGRLVIVVDDGTATGSTMTAALRAIRARQPKKLFAAVAVASEQAAEALLAECDQVICLEVPANFSAVGQFFEDFSQLSDEQVTEALCAKPKKIVLSG